MQFTKRVLEYVLALDVDGEILSTNACVSTFKFGPEVSTFHVKVQNSSMIHEDSKRAICQVCGRLA
jgi:hypothetical protein